MAARAMTYPSVADEFETVAQVRRGFSLARFGDGELKMSEGNGYRRQHGSQKLADELTAVLRNPARNCIVGIPTMDPRGPKILNWERHKPRFARQLNQYMRYYSAFVSRPDSAPWIENAEYAQSVVNLWAGKRVVILCERKGSIFRAVRPAARQAVHVECPTHQAYDYIDMYEYNILRHTPEIVIMSCGPTATCLASRLSARGVHAVDLGSIGQFICRTLYA